MNYATTKWYLKAIEFLKKTKECYGRYERFMNCHLHPKCLVKYECAQDAYKEHEPERIGFT
jgi:hypothetical protein